MFTLLLGFFIGSAIGSYQAFRPRKPSIQRFFGAFAIGAAAGILAGFFVALFLGFAMPKIRVAAEPVQLAAMRSSDGVTGTFMLGSGTVESTVRYRFMQRAEDGSFVPGSVRADDTVHIIEDHTLLCSGSWQTTYLVPDRQAWLYNWVVGADMLTEVARQDFRVPAGTVQQQFNIG